MSDFKAKMHQIRYRLGLRPDPAGGAYSALQAPLLDLTGILDFTSKGREEGIYKREGKEEVRKKEMGGEGKGDGRRRSPCADFTI